MTENERLPDEELPEQHEDDDAGPSTARAVTNPFSPAVIGYLVRFDHATAHDDDDLGSSTRDADSHTPHTLPLWRGEMALTVTIDLTQPTRQAREACEGHERLREAIAAYAADHIAEKAWPRDLLMANVHIAEDADNLAEAADWVRDLIGDPLRDAADSAGMPGPLATVGTGVFATFVTSDITEPIEETAKIINAVGVIVGLVTGMHPLVVACGERWARSTITGFMQKAMAEVIKPAHDGSLATSEDIEIAAAANDRAHIRRAVALGLRPAPHGDTSLAPDHKSTRNDIRFILMSPREHLAGDATGEATSAIDGADDTSSPFHRDISST